MLVDTAVRIQPSDRFAFQPSHENLAVDLYCNRANDDVRSQVDDTVNPKCRIEPCGAEHATEFQRFLATNCSPVNDPQELFVFCILST